MKIIASIGLFILFIYVLSLAVCYGAPEDAVIASLGEYDKHVFFTSGGFQDYTDYAKYYYTSSKIPESKYLKKIHETDFETINKHLDNFEEWIEAIKDSDASSEVVVNYDFDRGIIDTEDYFHNDI